MHYDPNIHNRRSIRLKGYDYSQAGMYFLTICAQERACLFGEIDDGVMCLSDAGRMIQSIWDEMPKYYFGVAVDAFVVMPNHIHGIVASVSAPAALSLSEIVRRFKTMTTKKYIDGVRKNTWPPFHGKLWQRNYWERIIRNEPELIYIREYIQNNPQQWELDKLHPCHAGTGPLWAP